MLPDTFSDKIGEKAPVSLDEMMTINASYYNYPNIFEIYLSGPIADKVDGFLPAYCTNAQVDYTGGQKFSTFDDGMPVHIQLTLNFLEIKAMTLGNYRMISAISNKGKKFGSTDSLNTSIGEIAQIYGEELENMTWEDGKKLGLSDEQLLAAGVSRGTDLLQGHVDPHYKKNKGNSDGSGGY